MQRIKSPKSGLKYKPSKKIEYATTTFRLPQDLLEEVRAWAMEDSTGEKDARKVGSLNNLVIEIFKWALEHRS